MRGSTGVGARVEWHERFRFEPNDVTTTITVEGDVDWVLHFASLTSPSDYLSHPIHTLKVGALGTLNALGLAKANGAGFLLASTSEVLVKGVWRLLISRVVGMPVNLGNPEEVTVLDLAHTIVLLAGSESEVIFTERPIDDPEVRCPDISRARPTSSRALQGPPSLRLGHWT